MKKYRIVKVNGRFYVERKFPFIGYRSEFVDFGGRPKPFASMEEVEQAIRPKPIKINVLKEITI